MSPGTPEKHYGTGECETYNDYRALIGRGDLGAVCLAMPDHWHAIPVVAAARAGGDATKKSLSLSKKLCTSRLFGYNYCCERLRAQKWSLGQPIRSRHMEPRDNPFDPHKFVESLVQACLHGERSVDDHASDFSGSPEAATADLAREVLDAEDVSADDLSTKHFIG